MLKHRDITDMLSNNTVRVHDVKESNCIECDKSYDNKNEAVTSGYYAVQKGRHGIKSCIFMFWQDCERFVKGYEEARYRVFEELEDAAEFAMMDNWNNDDYDDEDSSLSDNDVDKTTPVYPKQQNSFQTLKGNKDDEARLGYMTTFQSIYNNDDISFPNIREKPLSLTHPTCLSEEILQDGSNLDSEKSPNLEELNTNLNEEKEHQEANAFLSDRLYDKKEDRSSLQTQSSFDDDLSESFEPKKRKRDPPSINEEIMPASTDKNNFTDSRENKTWEENIQLAKKYQQDEWKRLGTNKKSVICCRPQHTTDKKLHSWLQRQVVYLKKGKLKLSRQERLMRELSWDVQKAVYFCTCYRFDEEWERMYNQLCDFYTSNGHSNVLINEHTDLSKWVCRQKEEYKKLRQTNKPSKLDLHKIQKLNDVEFPFPKHKGKKYKWEERLQQLQNYKDLYGHFNIPRFFDTAQFPGLGDWIDTQRYYFDKFFHSPHTFKNSNRIPRKQRERIKQLQEMGLEFPSVESRRPISKWVDMLERLKEFKAKHGHLMVPQKEPLLGQWVKGQRKQYNYLKAGKPSNMTGDKVIQLTEIGFEFYGKKGKKSEYLNSTDPLISITEHQGKNTDTENALIGNSATPFYFNTDESVV